jgi:signal peptidase II
MKNMLSTTPHSFFGVLAVQSKVGGSFVKFNFRAYFELAFIGGTIIALDQWTKTLVRANLDYMEAWSPWPWLMPYARLLHIHNTGAAFGMGQQFSYVFMALSMIVACLIFYFYPQVARQDWPLRAAMIMQFGGAIGNLIDRFAQGYVTDFVSVGTFAVFNVADASISVGVAVLIVGMLLKEYQERKTAAQSNAAEEDIPAPPASEIATGDLPGE